MDSRNPNGRVVVGVDNSPQALEVVRYALGLAQERNCDLTLAHAWSFPWAAGYFTAEDVHSMQADAESVTRAVMGGLEAGDNVHIDVVTSQEPVIPFLRRLSESARLVVIGRHEYWAERALDGDVSSALATKASCPVVTVPRRPRESGLGSGPVVICLDGNIGATESLRFAFEEADRSDRTLLAFHAVGPHSDPDEVETDRRDIAEITAGWQEQFPNVLVMHETVVDNRSDAIIAASEGAAMVVVGSPHRPTWSWLYSLARTVLNRVDCPLVVVPQHVAAQPRHTSRGDFSVAPVPTY